MVPREPRQSLIVFTSFVCLPFALAAAQPPAEGDQHALAHSLVRQLGHPSFVERERAMRGLAGMGVAAKEALLAGLKSPDAEVRDRCRRALVDVLEIDYQLRLAAFLADKGSASDCDLPGWQRFRHLAGDSAPARELFYEMHQAEPGLLESAEATPAVAAQVLEDRLSGLQNTLYRAADGGQRWLSLGTVAALFFVATDANIPVPDRLAQMLHNFSYQQPFAEALAAGPKATVLRKLLGAWVARNTDGTAAYLSMMMALRYELREALEPALNLVRTQAGQPQMLQAAMLAVGKFGDRQHVPFLEQMLANNSELFKQNVSGKQMRTEVRDVALAVLIHLTGQEHQQYGLVRLQRNTQTLFNATSIGYFEEEERLLALKKWREWAAQHPVASNGGQRRRLCPFAL